MFGFSQVEVDEDPVEAKEDGQDENTEVVTLFYYTFL